MKLLLRQAIRYVQAEADITRAVNMNPRTGRMSSSVSLRVAKMDMWLARARSAVAKPRAKR